MGSRTRRRGITNAALRAARAAALAKDDEASKIARTVHGIAVAMRDNFRVQRLAYYAPLQMACEVAAGAIVRAHGLAEPEDRDYEAVRADIANYLIELNATWLADFNVESFEQWRRDRADALREPR